MTATWVALIARSRIILNRQYIPCSLYQTCLVRDSGEFTLGGGMQEKPGSEFTIGAGTQVNIGMLAGGESNAGLGPLVNLNVVGGGEMQGGGVMGGMGGTLRGGGQDASTGGGGAVVKPDVVMGEWSTAMVVLSSVSIVMEVLSEAGVMSVQGETQTKSKEKKIPQRFIGLRSEN